MDEKLLYALRNMLPPVSQAQRLVGNDSYYADKRGQSVAGYFGVPARFLTEGQKEREQRRRTREASNPAESAREAALAAFVSDQ